MEDLLPVVVPESLEAAEQTPAAGKLMAAVAAKDAFKKVLLSMLAAPKFCSA